MSSAKKRRSGGAEQNKLIKKAKSGDEVIAAVSVTVTDAEYIQINAVKVGYALEHFVNKLSRQVDEDWHDGYEDQAITKKEWFWGIREPLRAVLNVGVKKKAELGKCNDVLNAIAESFHNLCEVPCRCDTENDLAEMNERFELDLPWGGTLGARSGNVVDAWSYVWVALLRVHSSSADVDDDLLLQCICDASDNMKGAKIMEFPGTIYDETDEDWDITFGNKDDKNAPSGDKLAQIVKEKAPECVWVEGKRVDLSPPPPPPPKPSADEEVLLAAGWTRKEYKEWIVPLGNSNPWRRPDPDEEDLSFIEAYAEPMDSSEFLSVEYSHEFEHLDDEGNANHVPTFKMTELHCCKKLTKETSALIGKILFNNHRLQYLDIDLMGIEVDIARAIFTHWHGKNCHLQCLKLENACLGGNGFSQFIQRLLHQNLKLVELKLNNTTLTKANARELANALSSGPSTLRHLSLMNDKLGDEGIKMISEAISVMPNMETIDLMGNNVTRYESIAKMIQAPNLRKINLRFCFCRGSSGKAAREVSERLVGEFKKSLKREANQWELTDFGDTLVKK